MRIKPEDKKTMEARVAKVVAAAAARRAQLAKSKAPVAAKASKPVAAAKAVKAEPENGGFIGNPMEPIKNKQKNLGEDEGLGYVIPPELKDAVEKAREESPSDKQFQPGVVIPPGLEDAVMASVVDPAEVSAGTEMRFELIPFVPENARTASEVLSAGAHWMLCMNGKPMAEINLRDQEHADKIAAHFVSHDYAQSVINGIQSHGLDATLKAVKAKPYVAKASLTKKARALESSLKAAAETELRAKSAALKAKYMERISLVLQASANNFIVENPLKDALVASLTNLGVQAGAATSIVDEAFFAVGEKTLAGFLDKAIEWANTSPEAMKEIEQAMHAAGRRSRPQVSANYNHALAAHMAAAALPIAPAVASPDSAPASVSAAVRIGQPAAAPSAAERKAQLKELFRRG
jgi:hypothetical protein